MHDRRHPRTGIRQREDPLPVGDIQLVEREPRERGQLRESSLFQAYIVIIVQAVDADHRLAAVEQRLRDVKTDKSRAPRQQDGQDSGRATMRSSSSSSTAWPRAMWHSWMRAVSLSG